MRTEKLEIYSFDELSNDAKVVAIESIRQDYYSYNDFSSWAVDDCSLLEPKHKELIDLFGENYNFPLIKNNRKVYFDTDRNRYIDISNAMEIQNSKQFLQWLGLNNRLIEKVDFTIEEDTIEFMNCGEKEFTEIETNKIVLAVGKFEEHCEDILKHIEADIDYRFTDEAITEDILSNDYEFLKSGKQKLWKIKNLMLFSQKTR